MIDSRRDSTTLETMRAIFTGVLCALLLSACGPELPPDDFGGESGSEETLGELGGETSDGTGEETGGGGGTDGGEDMSMGETGAQTDLGWCCDCDTFTDPTWGCDLIIESECMLDVWCLLIPSGDPQACEDACIF